MLFLFSMCICCLFFSEDSAVSPPPYPPPLVCAILPWNRLGNQFLFPCIFLTISLLPTFLSGSKNFLLGGLVAPVVVKPSFFHFRYSATHGEQFAHKRRIVPGDGAAKLLCWIPLFFEYLFADSPKTLCWFPTLLQPKSTILSHFQVFFRETTGYKPMQIESCHHFQADR
ncbi:hypothetical protein ADH76_01195 [Enterocloster clostridioformis]|nr:hypothetical protein A4V08_03215 [Lachnoclostridium sp. YL32]OXE70108.1 hypothetical protein ADH76_01195 [Enterocloster clostridioformis]